VKTSCTLNFLCTVEYNAKYGRERSEKSLRVNSQKTGWAGKRVNKVLDTLDLTGNHNTTITLLNGAR